MREMTAPEVGEVSWEEATRDAPSMRVVPSPRHPPGTTITHEMIEAQRRRVDDNLAGFAREVGLEMGGTPPGRARRTTATMGVVDGDHPPEVAGRLTVGPATTLCPDVARAGDVAPHSDSGSRMNSLAIAARPSATAMTARRPNVPALVGLLIGCAIVAVIVAPMILFGGHPAMREGWCVAVITLAFALVALSRIMLRGTPAKAVATVLTLAAVVVQALASVRAHSPDASYFAFGMIEFTLIVGLSVFARSTD